GRGVAFPGVVVAGFAGGGRPARVLVWCSPRREDPLPRVGGAGGGPGGFRPNPAALEMLRAIASMPPEQGAEAAVPFIYDPSTPRRLIDEDIAVRRRSFARHEGYQAQLQAILSWESFSRLEHVAAPTLVIHGKNDRLVPPGNGEIIASRIPGAQLVLLENAGHIFSTDQPHAAHRAIQEFLSSRSTPARP